ncbi:MAG TPA: hypothetical protein DCP78_06610 [Sphingobacterium sp.]|nr:hypothetical protein [Sphingobacterium sp.]
MLLLQMALFWVLIMMKGGIKPMRRSSAINISIPKMPGLTPMTSGISALMPIARRPGLMKRLRSIPSPFVAWAY